MIIRQTMWHRLLPAAAASIDQYLLLAGLAAAAVGPMLGQKNTQTDRWTPYYFIDSAPHTIIFGQCQLL